MDLPEKPSADRFENLPVAEQEAVRSAAQALHQFAYQHVVPMTICTPSGQGFPGPINNGTASLVRYRDGIIAITAGHVISHLRTRQKGGAAVQLRLANVAIDLESRLCWMDKASDLAAFVVTPVEASVLGTLIAEVPDLEEVPVPAPGSYVLCVGFPVYLRDQTRTELEYGALSGLLRVTTAGEDYFICQFERETWIAAFEDAIPSPGTQLGGLSGGPVFGVARLNYPLIGIVTDFHDSFELLRVQSIRSLLQMLP